MKKRTPRSKPSDKPGEKAEVFLPEEKQISGHQSQPADILELIEALRTHQVELKMQNEELRRAYEELEKARDRYSDLYNFSPVGYFTLDENNLIIEANITGAELLGLERRRLPGTRFTRLISPDDLNRFYRHREKCLETLKTQTCELKLKSEENNPRFIQLESVSVSDDEGNFNRIRTAMIEITDRKKTHDRIQSLSRDILKSHETERQMIARELHDGIAQEISVAKMKIDTLMSEYPDSPKGLTEKTSELSLILGKVISSVRDLSYDLSPPDLKISGLVKGLAHFCSEFSDRYGIKVSFFSAGTERIKLDDQIRLNLYRLVQEALNNVRKHAEATLVEIQLSYDHPDIILNIKDNGRGFDVDKRLAALNSEKRMGLRSIEERVTLLNGTLSLHSAPGHGTNIFINLPYGQEDDR